MVRTRRRLIRLIALGLVADFTGLGLRAQTSPDLELRDSLAVARDISGTWEGTFTLDSTWRLPGAPSSEAVGTAPAL